MSEVAKLTDEEFEAQLPKPVGYHILIALPQVDDTYEGSSLVKTEHEKKLAQVLSIVGAVIDVGSEAYKDTARFGDTPWCKIGDYVMFRANSGTRFRIEGVEYRLLNDDSIEAVVPDPRSVARA